MIRAQIERLRLKMHNTALNYGISHSKVIQISRILDKKINQYMRKKL